MRIDVEVGLGAREDPGELRRRLEPCPGQPDQVRQVVAPLALPERGQILAREDQSDAVEEVLGSPGRSDVQRGPLAGPGRTGVARRDLRASPKSSRPGVALLGFRRSAKA